MAYWVALEDPPAMFYEFSMSGLVALFGPPPKLSCWGLFAPLEPLAPVPTVPAAEWKLMRSLGVKYMYCISALCWLPKFAGDMFMFW